ncbi:uncharacterized protein LOC143038001 isoform X3 [Oratosquilla oratoria]|uniref:uncharacterized protein LOC143038001 isoform X3 n=1 Tax=Oratosquilla oratoria TaxID=337810 RepID=UPI003F75F945
MIKMPVLRTCCCCVSLRKGTVIIAVLGIIFETTVLIGAAVTKENIISYITSGNTTETTDETFMMLFIEEWKSNTTSEIVSGIFFLFLWGLLIAGVYYRHEKMFLLWLAVEAVTLGIYAIVKTQNKALERGTQLENIEEP